MIYEVRQKILTLLPIMQKHCLECGERKTKLNVALKKFATCKIDDISDSDMWDMWDALGRISRTNEQEELYICLGVLNQLRGNL